MDLEEPLTWEKVQKILEEWMDYGDDPFDDQYAEYAYELSITTDPERAALLKKVLRLMDFLRKFID